MGQIIGGDDGTIEEGKVGTAIDGELEMVDGEIGTKVKSLGGT